MVRAKRERRERTDNWDLIQQGTVDVLGDLALPLTGSSSNGGQR